MLSNWEQEVFLFVPASAFVLTALSVPIAGRLATHWRCIAVPNADRWHSRATPPSGGLAFFFPIALLAVGFSYHYWNIEPFLILATAAVLLGV